MFSSSTSAEQTVATLLSASLDLPARATREVDVDGRTITVHGTGTDATVISRQGNAVVLRRHIGDQFIVTGASARHNPSEPLEREDAIRLALSRLDR